MESSFSWAHPNGPLTKMMRPQSTPRLAMAPQQKLKLPQAWQTNQAPQQKPNKAQRSTEQPQDETGKKN